MEKFADFAIKRRLPLLVVILLITLFFLYQLINPLGFFTDAPILKLRVDTDFADLLPQRHPYIKIHNKIKETFGGANQVIIMVQVRDGDIFNQETLGKVKEISERLEQFPAVDRYKIRSIAMSKMKHFKFTSGTMDISPLMFPEIPHNQEEMEELKKKIYSENRYYGPYVSWDSKKTLILVDFFEEELAEIGYDEVFRAFIKLQQEMEDENHIINIAGEPVHLGYIRALNRKVLVVLGITTLAIMILLYFYYRSKRGMFIPIMSAVASGIWGLGFPPHPGTTLFDFTNDRPPLYAVDKPLFRRGGNGRRRQDVFPHPNQHHVCTGSYRHRNRCVGYRASRNCIYPDLTEHIDRLCLLVCSHHHSCPPLYPAGAFLHQTVKASHGTD